MPGRRRWRRDGVERDPLDEAAHRRLMLSLAQAGDRAAAIRQYRACVAVLERELGVPPLDETTALYEAIRDGRIATVESPRQSAPAAAPSETAPAAPSSPFIGRDPELGRLMAGHATSRPDGRLAVVEGEAGIGKTRLLDELAAAARRAGATVLATCAYTAEAGIPYGVVVELLRAARRDDASSRRLDGLPDPVRAELSRLVDVGPVPPPPSSDGPGAKARLLAAIADGLTAAVEGSDAGCIVVDDVHAADDASREALAWLARRLAGRPLLLVLAWRPEDLDAAGLGFAASVAGAVTTRIALERLGPDDAVALARALQPGGRDDDAVRALAARAEGLPLYLVEAAAGDASVLEGSPPAAMGTLVRERLATLGGSATQVLTAAAVIGRSFEPGTVRRASGRSEDEVVDALDELLARGIVRELGVGADGEIRYDFAHGLIRDVVYEGTSLARRRLLHRRVADALRAGPRGRDDVARLTRIASHEQAAGRDAEAAEAYREAGSAPRSSWPRRRASVTSRRPSRWVTPIASISIGASASCGRGSATTRGRCGPSKRLPRSRIGRRSSAWNERSPRSTSGAATRRPQTGISRRRWRPCLRTTTTTARGCWQTGRSPPSAAANPFAAAAYAEEALTRATGVGDRATIVLAHRVAGLAARAAGDLPGATAELEASLALSLESPDIAARVAARNALALVSVTAGRRDEAVAHAQAALADVRSIGDRHLEAVVENTLADTLHAAGRDDESLEHLKRAVALFADVGGAPTDLTDAEPGVWALETW